MKFTYKTIDIKSSVKWRHFYPPEHQVRLDKSIVGYIDDVYPHRITLITRGENNKSKNFTLSYTMGFTRRIMVIFTI